MKLVLAYEVGKRTVSSATRFIDKLSTATHPEKRFQLTTDGLAAYTLPVGNILGERSERVDFAQLVKVYKEDAKEERRRYSPAKYVKAIPTVVSGEPDETRISTSHIERQNGSLRQWCKRLTRLTYAFRKTLDNHKAALALHLASTISVGLTGR
jgi:IS1 family transposase